MSALNAGDQPLKWCAQATNLFGTGWKNAFFHVPIFQLGLPQTIPFLKERPPQCQTKCFLGHEMQFGSNCQQCFVTSHKMTGVISLLNPASWTSSLDVVAGAELQRQPRPAFGLSRTKGEQVPCPPFKSKSFTVQTVSTVQFGQFAELHFLPNQGGHRGQFSLLVPKGTVSCRAYVCWLLTVVLVHFFFIALPLRSFAICKGAKLRNTKVTELFRFPPVSTLEDLVTLQAPHIRIT